jgi:predicted AlkP superfamily pyrophosphatase or phosphodiesterase
MVLILFIGFCISVVFPFSLRHQNEMTLNWVPSDIEQRSTARRVLIFGLDGVGDLPFRIRTPALGELFETGLFTRSAMAVFPSFSYECWTSLFRSVLPSVHHVMTEGTQIPSPSTHSLFKLVSDHNLTAASIVNWEPINLVSIEPGLPHVYREFVRTDEELLAKFYQVVAMLDPSLIFIQYDPCDAAGHRYGYFTNKQIECLKVADAFLGTLMKKLRSMSGETFIIAVADHGGGGDHPRSHGTANPADMTVFLAVAGPRVPAAAIQEPVSLLDIAPTAAMLLNLSIPSDWAGNVPSRLSSFRSM